MYALLLVLEPEPDADELVIDIAEAGRRNGSGDTPPGFGDEIAVEEGC